MGDPRDALMHAGRRFWAGEKTSLPDAGPMAVEFGLGKEAEAFEAETRAFFDKTLTPAWHAKSHYSYAGHDWDLYRKKGAARLLYPTWPVEYGGRGLNSYGAAAQLEAWEDYGVTSHAQSVSNMVGHVIIRFGSEALKKKIMPRLTAGEVIMSLGYSEPSSGSDIFAAKTKAVRDGDGWIVNGQKMFTSGANLASHVFLLARTNPDAPKHKGITMFLVPLDAPGVEIHPVHTFQDERTNATFYSDVRIPDENRIGPVDGALEILSWALSLEQGGGGFVGPHRHVFEAAVDWARTAIRDGKPALQNDRVLERLAHVAAHVQLSYLIFWRSQWLLETGVMDRAAGPMSKVFSSEVYLRDAMDMLDLAAPDTLLRGKHGLGLIELRHRHSTVTTVYGGTSEVHRSQVAENTFAFPKSR
jgi:alkylation response protein AidB-like acyl-CoA dehydrogenase